jgi:RimJ/RimL family protein N-acetyltransferase
MTIETPRLLLTPYSPAHLCALLEGIDEFEQVFGAPAADGLRTFLVSDDVSPEWLARLQAASTPDPWVHGFAIVDRASGSVIGSLGFKGRPDDDGVVEIAYGIVPAFQHQGLGTEATQAGLAFAFEIDAVARVRAHTRPSNTASTRVLEKCGFDFIGPVNDPDDGSVWRWERGRRE